MFTKAFAFACLLLAPFAAALTVDPLTNAMSQSEVTVTWKLQGNNEPTYITIELHHESFRADLAIATTIDTTYESLVVKLGSVPAQFGYTIRLVNIGNISDIYAESAPFAIGALNESATSSSSGTGSSSSGTAGSTSARSTTTNLPSSIAQPPTSTRTSTSTATGATFDNGAASTRYSVAGFLAVVAGAVAIVL